MKTWPTLPSFESAHLTQLNDRRRGVRQTPAVPGTHLWIDQDQRIPVEIVDESVDGVGIVIPCEYPFEIGPRVYVDYDQERRIAMVVHLARRIDCSYHLGLEWLPLSADDDLVVFP